MLGVDPALTVEEKLRYRYSRLETVARRRRYADARQRRAQFLAYCLARFAGPPELAAGKLDLGTALLSTLALAEAEVEALNREADVARDAVRINITYGEERP